MAEAPELLQGRHRVHSWRGLVVSISIHGLLIVLAGWVVLQYVAPVKEELVYKMVVAGGGAMAASEHRTATVKRSSSTEVKLRQRLTVKNSTSSCVAPYIALPAMKAGTLSGANGTGIGKGGRGQGFSRGLGQGLGTALGFVGKPVLGATIKAKKVAVYLDCSGSMKPYLERVNREIRQQFPDADVFRFDGARVVASEKNVVFGRGFHGVAPPLNEAPSQTVMEDLTPHGKQCQERFGKACEKGSLGAWMDHMLEESYDALVVFSDFQDGVRIYEAPLHRDPRLIYSDSYYHPVNHGRAARYPWEQHWLEKFALGQHSKGPRLYLFTVQQEPQPLLLKCVTASGGASTSVSWLKKKKSATESR